MLSVKYNKSNDLNTTSVTLSQQASRFWIPFDMKLFENLSPIEYLEKYCRVSNRRYTLYKRIFDKHKDFDLTLVVEILPDTLVDVYMDTIDKRLINQAIRVLDLPINTKITFAQFRGIAAFSERYFFNLSPQSICANSRLNKDVLELLDFSCLEWKLIGIISMREQVRQHEGVSNPRSDLIQIQGIDYDERELSTSMSVISFDESDLSGNILNDLDHIYTQRSHQRCMMLTYLTLLSMTCAALSWMIYWLLYNQFVLIFQILIFSFLGISPCLFILMIISWLIFSCRNPFDRIRTNFICFRLEGIHWQNQLNYYFKQKSCWNYFPRKKLIDRNFGYIILSPHGIVFDELFLKISCKPIIVNGIFVEHDRILKFECKKIPTKEFLVYLPEELIKPETFEELTRILKIPMNGARF